MKPVQKVKSVSKTLAALTPSAVSHSYLEMLPVAMKQCAFIQWSTKAMVQEQDICVKFTSSCPAFKVQIKD